MHDLGKMIFAFSIFWMYLFFAQYIVIWYGNLPEETQFFERRGSAASSSRTPGTSTGSGAASASPT